MPPRQTALGRLLQDRREAAGYSRARIAEAVGIKAGTIEGWELGRVARPPIHDILRLAHYLKIQPDEVQRAVFADADGPAQRDAGSVFTDRRPRGQAAVPLLDAAFRLFGWRDDTAAGEVLGVSPDQVAVWRSGAEQMPFVDYLTLTSMIGVAAAEAMKGDNARIADLDAAAELLGLEPVPVQRR